MSSGKQLGSDTSRAHGSLPSLVKSCTTPPPQGYRRMSIRTHATRPPRRARSSGSKDPPRAPARSAPPASDGRGRLSASGSHDHLGEIRVIILCSRGVFRTYWRRSANVYKQEAQPRTWVPSWAFGRLLAGQKRAPCRIRTDDPRFTRAALWPAELRGRHCVVHAGSYRLVPVSADLSGISADQRQFLERRLGPISGSRRGSGAAWCRSVPIRPKASGLPLASPGLPRAAATRSQERLGAVEPDGSVARDARFSSRCRRWQDLSR
jgi:hypothetical protein